MVDSMSVAATITVSCKREKGRFTITAAITVSAAAPSSDTATMSTARGYSISTDRSVRLVSGIAAEGTAPSRRACSKHWLIGWRTAGA